ncbi:MAG: NUDIX hydrolase [Rubripirellula sp.]
MPEPQRGQVSSNRPPLNYQDDPSRRRGVVAVIFQEKRLLVIRRSQTVTAPGMLCLPGGGIEIGETERQAVIREMQEELNIQIEPKERCWRNTTSWGTDLAWWHATIVDGQDPVANPEEVEQVFWMTKKEIQASGSMLPSLPQFMDAWQRGEVNLDQHLLLDC